jgi:hypothetical protein
LDENSYEEVGKYCHDLWMSSSIGQNPTFSCQQVVSPKKITRNDK